MQPWAPDDRDMAVTVKWGDESRVVSNGASVELDQGFLRVRDASGTTAFGRVSGEWSSAVVEPGHGTDAPYQVDDAGHLLIGGDRLVAVYAPGAWETKLGRPGS